MAEKMVFASAEAPGAYHLIKAAEKELGPLFTDDQSEPLLDVALRENWDRGRVMEELADAFAFVAAAGGLS